MSDIYEDIEGLDDFQDGGHGGHFGFSKVEKCDVVGPTNIHTKFGVDWFSGVACIYETKV